MKNPLLSLGIAVVSCLTLATSLAFAGEPSQRSFGKGNPFTVEELPAGKLKAKLQTIDPQARGKAMKWLHELQFEEFDAANHLRVDKDGGVYIVCPDDHGNCDGHSHPPAEAQASPSPTEEASIGEPPASEPPVTASAAVSINSPPIYNSKPGASKHIYLDFNGASVSGKSWSETDGVTTWTSWVCAAWSTDGDTSTFSDSEQTSMRQVWERISEDYAPFDVNVTTDVAYDPVSYTGDKNKVGWLLFTNTTDTLGARCPHYGSGGVAYVGVYGNSNYFSSYQPAWVTPSSAANMAEAGSHEMGHNMGLNHDGTTAPADYYGGHAATASAPSWGPIMGTGYGRNVSQWSKGEYYNSAYISYPPPNFTAVINANTQDDLAVISARVAYRTDDHGSTFGTATTWTSGNVNQGGIIERTNDIDTFTFNAGAGPITLSAAGYKCATGTWGGNLDTIIELYDNSLNLVASNNAADQVNSSLSASVPAGRYYVMLKPAAAGSPLTTTPSGYTIYGSLGQYQITGSFVPATGIILSSPGGGESWVKGASYNITWGSAMGGNVKLELLKAGSLNTTIAASTPNNGSFAWAIPGGQTVGSDYKIRITSVEDPTKTDQSLSNFSITTDPLGEALDTSGLVWTTSGDLPWFSQTTTTHDGIDAAQSGAIGNSQASSMETTTVGAGTMTFWWKVSSETNYDFLRFYLNGTEQTGSLARISGNINWVQKTVTIPSGSNVVRWSYTKDSSAVGNLDTAWVDQVVFTPNAAPDIVVEQPVGTGLADGASTVDFGSVSVGTNKPLTFTIRNTGTEDLTGLAVSKSGANAADYTIGSLSATTLLSGASTTFTITFNPAVAGTRTAAIQIASNDPIKNPFDINLTGVGLGPGSLAVAGTGGLTSSGNLGGPFSPSSIQYTLSNPGSTSITWTAAKTANWVNLSSASGTLAAGASTNVTVSINANANSLAAGSYNDTVSFNSSTTGSTTRAVALTVNTPPVANAGPDQSIFVTGSSWTPAETSLGLWLDASDDATVTLNAGNVSQWADKSGLGRNATAAGTSQPAATAAGLNGKRVLTFNGSSNVLNVDLDFLAGINHSAFIVTKPTAFSNIYGAANGSAGANSLHVGFSSASSYRMNFWGNDYGPALTANFVAGSANIMNYVWTAGTGKQILANGKSEGTNTNAGVIGTMSGGGRIGRTTGHAFFGGDIAEFIAVTGDVSLADRQKAEGYLAHKWGLAANLDAAHPYKAASPNNASATANLAGTASDADGNSIVTTWSFVSGPAAVVFGNASSVATTATFTTAGVYTLRLTVTDGFTQVSDDVVITVNPAPAGFTVTYAGNGSTGGSVPVDGANYSNGATVTVLGNTGSLTRTGYTFAGWNTAANGSGTNYSAGNTFGISSNVNLYAKWTANSYTVSFNANGGAAPSPASKSVTYGSAYGALATTTRTGYTFAGWFTAASGGTEVTSSTNVSNASNHTLFAQWTGNAYTVTFDPNGGGTPNPTSKSVNYGSTYGTLATVARTGYTLNGWYTAATGGSLVDVSTTVTATADHTLYAQWTVSTYTVSYNANNAPAGSAPANQTKTYGVNLTLATNSGGLSRTGYTFTGWNTAADGAGTNYGAGATYTDNASTTLYAKWTANNYTVTFDPNGGQAPVPTSKQVTYDSTYDALATTTRDGYSFNGWFTAAQGGSQVTTGTTVAIAANHTLYAQWRQLIVGMDVSRSSTVIAVGGFDALDGTTMGLGAKLNYDITNGGTNTLTLGGVVISGETNCVVAIDSPPSASVSPSSFTGLVLTATPSAAGAWSFTISIANNHPDKNPYTWTVHGVAQSSTTVSLVAVADTYISAAATTTNYGTATTFSVLNRSQGSKFFQGLLRFDLSSIPTNATVTTASLDLFQDNTQTGPVSAYESTGAWTETGATWANSNLLFGTTSYGTASAPGTAGGGVSIGLDTDGVDKVQSWITTPAGNYGFGVKTTNSGNNTNIDLRTREHATTANRPKLTLTYTASPQVAEMHVARAGMVVADGGTDSVPGSTPGSGTQLTYAITNLGNANLTLTTPVSLVAGSNCSVAVNSQPANTVTASNATALVVTVTPTAAGAWSATVSIANNDSDENPYNWTISGTTANAYAVTFDKQGGTGGDSGVAATSGQPMPTAAAPTRTGYTFGGYFTAINGGGTQYYTAAMASARNWDIAANTTLYARWTANSYTITFDSAGGTAVTAITQNFGTTVTAPANPTRSGYTFAGWSPALPSTMPANSQTVTAQWTASTYTVTFNANGGSTPSPTGKTVTLGSTYGTLATTNRTGYTFNGWFTAASGGSLVTSGTTVATASNHTLHAQWTINSYTITFNSAGGSSVTAITQSFGTTVTAPANPTRSGYTFAGWSPALPSTMPATSQTVTAQWTINSYTITFDSAGGSAVTAITQNFGTTVTAPANPTRSGYTFTAWSPVVPGTMPASNLTVTAQWTADTYTVTFDANGGGTPSPTSTSVTFGSAYGTLATITRTGYTFNGWFTASSGGTLVSAATTVSNAANHTLYAQWTADTYTVTFNANGGGTPSPTSTSVTFGSAYGTLATIARTGYTFNGWFTASTGGTLVSAATTVSNAANHTLHAQWTAETYTVTFNANGGGTPSPTTKTVTFGSAYGTLATITRTGYTFNGWFTASSGGTLVSTATTVSNAANHTLHAQWTAGAYTVTFNANGGDAPSPTTKAVTFGSAYGTLATTSRTDYTFNGWFTASSGGSLVTAATTVNTSSNHMLYAQWSLTNSLANPGGPYTVFINQSLTLNGSASLPSGGATLSTYTWDLNNDGTFGDVTGANPAAISYATLTGTWGMGPGLNTIQLRVTDSAAKTSTVSTTVNLALGLTWDANGTGAGQTNGGGAWLGANQWWDGSSNANWVSGSNAVLGGPSTNGDSVTLASPTSAGSITFNTFTGTYTLGTAGQALTVSGDITNNSASGAVTIISPLTLGAAQAWQNDSSGLLKASGGLDNGGRLLTFDGAGSFDFSGTANLITGAGGITMNGAGRLVLGAGGTIPVHNYSGTTTINNGVVMIASGNLGSGNLTLNGGVIETYWATNFTRALGGGAGQMQLTGGASGFSMNGSNGASVIINNDAAFEVVWGSTFFKPSTLVLQASSAQNSSSLNFQNKIDLNGATRTIFSSITTGSGAGSATISGVIRNSTGTAGITKTGTGLLILSATNTYNGNTTVSQGTLRLNAINANNESSTVTIAPGATLDLSFTGTDTVNKLFIGSTEQPAGVYKAVGSAATGTELAQITGTGTLTVTGPGDTTPPTLASSGIVDNKGGAPITVNTLVTYTVTFSEDMDASTVTAAAFGNAGTSTITIGAVTETSPTSGVFTVLVTPTSAGSLQLRVNAGAVLKDAAGNNLNTTTAIADNTTITVQSAYNSWAGGPGFNADSNGDGIANGIAWVVGASNTSANAASLLPTTSSTADVNYLTYTYRRIDAANLDPNTTITVEYGSSLSGWNPATNDGTNTIITTTNDFYGTGIDRVVVRINKALAQNGKLFSRLKVVQAP